MKKKAFLLALLALLLTAVKAQTVSITGFGGYTFQDRANFGNAYANIKESGHWGIALEGTAHNRGLELLYQQQNTHVPVYFSGAPDHQVNEGNDKIGISYIVLNGLQYVEMPNSPLHPYGGLGAGVGIMNPQSGSSQTGFAWDLKLGVKIKTKSVVGFKIQAQLFSIVQAGAAGFWVGPGGGGVSFGGYSSIYQFGLTGGICFDLDKH